MVSKVAFRNTLELPAPILSDLWGNRYSNHIESVFFTAKHTKETQSTQSMYGTAWNIILLIINTIKLFLSGTQVNMDGF